MAPLNCNLANPDLTHLDDITKNLFGGITPFFALLGQQFTNTYLSQSISICDWIVFASVPTGVPFALTAIIRVSKRNNVLRSLSVHPEEENKYIERDLLSSTSEEVCEIWNGRGATRKLAPLSQLPITEWIFDGTLMSSKQAKTHVLIKKAAKHEKSGLDEWEDKAETELPPNLIMNLGPYNRVWKLLLLTVVGSLLQSSIVILTALTAFYCPVRQHFFARAKSAYGIAAPTLVWAGTLFLTCGLIYTAKTIDTSARVDIWKPTKEGVMVIWKQDKKDFEEIHTERYVIGKVIKKELISTHRRLRTRPSTSHPVLVAFVLTIGFVSQSVGIFLMHWPLQALQLLSMIIMFLGRCYVRSQEPPDFVQKLDHDISHRDLLELAQKWRRQRLRSEHERN